MLIAILLLAAGTGFVFGGKALLSVHWILGGALILPGASLLFIGAMGLVIEISEKIKKNRPPSNAVEKLTASVISPAPGVTVSKAENSTISLLAGRRKSPIRGGRDE